MISFLCTQFFHTDPRKGNILDLQFGFMNVNCRPNMLKCSSQAFCFLSGLWTGWYYRVTIWPRQRARHLKMVVYLSAIISQSIIPSCMAEMMLIKYRSWKLNWCERSSTQLQNKQFHVLRKKTIEKCSKMKNAPTRIQFFVVKNEIETFLTTSSRLLKLRR